MHKPPWKHLDWAEIAELSKTKEIVSLHPLGKTKTTPYPLDRVKRKFGTDYFSNTVAYMIAYALYQGYEDIKLYGCDTNKPKAYAQEKDGVEYWIGYARGQGTKVWIAPGGTLCKTVTGHPYGTDGDIRIRIWQELQAKQS